MKMSVKVSGISGIKKKLGSHIDRTERKAENAFIRGLKFLIDKAVSITPIDRGDLRESAFTDFEKSIHQISGTIGFNAYYAKWVHQYTGKLKGQKRAHFGRTREGVEFGGGSLTGNYWDGGEPQFLEKAVMRNHDKFIKDIKDNIKVK